MSEVVTFGTCLEGVPYTDRPAAYAVIAGANGTVAAVQGPSGMIGLPGGGSWPGETAEETLHREMREELAHTVRLVRKIGTAVQYFYAGDDRCHYRMSAVFFLAELADHLAGPREHELIWLPLTEADRAFFHACHAWAVRRGLEASALNLASGLVIRPEVAADHEAIRQVNRLAFGQDEEARLVDELRAAGYVRVSLVAERDQQVVGHILFSDLPIHTESGVVQALALAPLAVVPDFQRQGIGSALVRRGLEVCAQEGHRIVVVLGHADYYPRFGFSALLARPLASPFAGDNFMAAELVPGALAGVSGEVQYPPPFGLPSRWR